MTKRLFLLAGLIALLLGVLLGCGGGGESARVTATPTKTPRPLFTATYTPTATPLPTDTPAPTTTPAPTNTPLPTNTPVIVTATPTLTETLPSVTDAPLPPTDTPQPTQPTKPAATKTPIPPTSTPQPSVDFKVKEIVAFEDGSLTQTGFHNVYLTVLDAAGAPLDGMIIEEISNQPPIQVTSGDKGPGKAEFTMYAGDYRFKVVGSTGGLTFSSEPTHILSVVFGHPVYDDLIRGGICADEAACRALGPMHYSYNVTFQKTR